MSRHTLTPPPYAVRCVRVDNLTLVPGNLLPFMEQWQEMANRLPPYAGLIVLPASSSAQKQTMLTVAGLLAAQGRQVRVISADEPMEA